MAGRPPICESLATKLDTTVMAMRALNLPSEDVHAVKKNLSAEICDMKNGITEMKEYINLVKKDLQECKVETNELKVLIEASDILNNYLPSTSVDESTDHLAEEASKKTNISTLRHISQGEWEGIPSYLRLRYKLEQVNEFIGVFNKKLLQKYTFLKKKRTTLSRSETPLWTSYKILETAETKGQHFLVDDDFKMEGKSQKFITCMSTILRHCRRLREIRTGKLVRYVVIKS